MYNLPLITLDEFPLYYIAHRCIPLYNGETPLVVFLAQYQRLINDGVLKIHVYHKRFHLHPVHDVKQLARNSYHKVSSPHSIDN